MRRLVLLITTLCLLPVTVWSYDLLIVQSQRSPAYDEVLRGFRATALYSERVIVLTDYDDIDLMRIVREENPAAIVTLGDNALAAARRVRQTPVIALMALSFRAGLRGHATITGVEVQSPPERYLAILASLRAHKVGIIGNASRSGAYIRQARKAAAGYGIDLVVREVKSSRDVSGQLASLSGQVDALWMLPDSVTASGEAADAHFLFSAVHRVPVITFSSAYLSSGAAVALEFDRFDIGRQAGNMASRLMDGTNISDIPPEPPRKTTVKSNLSVLRQLDLKPDLPGSRGAE